jgi:hypothetical protein
MQANDSLFDDSTEWKPVEKLIDFLENRIRFRWVFTKPVTTFFSKSKGLVNPFIFVITSKKMDLIREFHFECHEQANRF